MPWSLPPGVTPADIDVLFEASGEDQCLSTEVEEQASVEPLTDEELAATAKLINEPDVF